MDDLAYGVRNKRGDWAPKDPLTIAPIYRLPWNAREIAIWFKDYLFPWAVTWMAIAALYWYALIPRVDTMRTLAPGWIAYLFLLNCAGVLLFFGAMELRLYIQRGQGTLFKFNGKFPGDNKSDVFMFKSQAIDGAIRTFGTGVPIWTAYEALILWCYANGYGAWTTFSAHPIWFVVLWFLIPGLSRVSFLLHPPPASFPAALQTHPLNSPQFGQSEPVVVTVDAPDRAVALLLELVAISRRARASSVRAVSPQSLWLWFDRRSHRVR